MRAFAQIDLFGGQLAILNVPEEQLYVHEEHKAISETVVRSVLSDFIGGNLAFRKLAVTSNH